MASVMPVVVYPPDGDGRRRVRVDGELLGRAYSLREVAEFLRPGRDRRAVGRRSVPPLRERGGGTVLNTGGLATGSRPS
ncbi:hypothetical protein AB0I98_48215 [Streptomyces sp. NPDC050211]|uniref:hypothetical protein n=1 Tax=Streptomyces sp. NPDC050211 TaxID=3154932 RepID=UPI0034120699